MKFKLLLIFIGFCLASCNTENSAKSDITMSTDSCFTLYKIIIRPDNSVADSIFVNCKNANLFFHKRINENGKLQTTGYILNKKPYGTYTSYGDDGKVVSWKATWKNENEIIH